MNTDARSPYSTFYILFSACCFGSIAIIITLATKDNRATLIDVLMFRYVIAGLLLFAVSGGLKPVLAPGKRAALLTLVGGGGQAAIAFTSLSALKYIPAASLTFLFYTYPAWVAIISAVRGVEKLTLARIGALALSLGGLAIMIGAPGAGGLNPIGVALALGSALLYAAYIPTINQLTANIDPSVTSTYSCFGATLIFLGAAIYQGGPSLDMPPISWAMIAVLAIVCTVMAFIAFLRGLRALGPVRTAIVSTIEPFWTALLGSVVLGQQLGPRTLAGGLLIAAAVVALQLRSAVPAKTPEP